jgi:hypothetical protein
MQGLRRTISAHRALFSLLAALALAARLVLPQGFMLAPTAGGITVMVCADSGSGPATVTIPMKSDPAQDAADSKAKEACPYSALGMGGLAAADIVLLATALAFLLLLGFGPQRSPPLQVQPRLLPPLRGPPAFA